MHCQSRVITALCLSLLFFCACNKVPDHRRYIPKDAALVAGINLKSLGKTIAWNMITGSKLFKEMQKRVPQKNGNDIMSGIDKAGIDALNSFYVYLKTDARYKGGINVTGLVPLSDASEWETFVKKNFPQAEIKQQKEIKTASLGNDMYVGWNKNLLIVMNMLSANGGAPADMSVEMESAFNIASDNSINSNKNFETLENYGHDLTMWINYEQIMNQYVKDGNSMGGLSLAPSIWKETAFACGFDFKKGKITGDLTWYSSNEMNEVYKQFGAANASKDMVERLPAKDLDVMFAIHLSPKAIRSVLDKTNMLGLVNAGLSSTGMDVDKLLDAFTGDMAFTMNSLSVKNAPGQGQMITYQDQKTDVNICYILKINKKENFNAILDIAKQTGSLMPNGNGFVIPLTAKDSLYFLLNDQYAVASNRSFMANEVLKGENKDNRVSGDLLSKVSGHPFAMYFDLRQAFKNIDLGTTLSPSDSVIYNESKNLLTSLSLTGGDYKNNAMEAHVEVNFANTEESSIFALLDFGMKISDAVEKSAKNTPMQPNQTSAF